MSTITKPMALDESFKTTETTPRNIADVLAEMGEAIAQGMGRQANEVAYDNTTSGLSADDVQEAIDELADEKVDKVSGKGLSTNDYTDAEKTKLAGIEQGAEVNVQSDWAQTDSSADDFIKNKQLVTEPIEELQNDVQSTQTATGNPITLTDCAPINAESLVVELSPKQDLHGYSYPWVGGSGKNKLPMTVDGIKEANTNGTWSGNVYTINNGTFTILTDNDGNVTGIKANGNFNETSLLNLGIMPVSSATQFICNGCPSGGSNTTYSIQVLNGSGTVVTDADNGSGVTFTADADKFARVVVRSGYSASNLIFLPMIRLSTETDATFAPWENICPITGYTQTSVEDVGKNLFDKTDVVNGGFNADGTVHESAADSRRVGRYIAVEPSIEYYISNAVPLTAGRTGFWYDENKTSISQITFPSTVQTSGAVTSPNNAKYIRLCVPSSTLDTAQLEVGNQATVYEPFQSTSATIQFGQTVYGGRSNFTDGGTDDAMGLQDLGDLSWARSTSYANPFFFANIPDRKTGGEYDYNPVSSAYRFDPINKTAGIFGNTGENGTFAFQGENAQIFIRNDAYTDANTFKTAMTGQKICFEKATHNTIATPPTDLKLLKGTNNLSADGVMQIGYQPDNVVGELKGEIENATPISGTVTATLLHEEDQGEDWIVGFTGEINGRFDPDHFDYYLTARYTHAYNDNTQILNVNNCTDGDYVQIWQTGTLDFSVDGGVTVTISVTATKLTFTVNCIGDSIFGIYSSSETTGQVKYLITPARKG